MSAIVGFKNLVLDWLRSLRCKHEWEDGRLVDFGRRKLYTCSKCSKMRIF